MGEVTIQPGEREKIISQPAQGDAYNIGVQGADIYLSHSSASTRNEGRKVVPGDRATLRHLRGKSIYAKNPPGNDDPAKISIDKAGFDIVFQSRPVVGAVQQESGDEAPAASDAFIHRYGKDVDVNAASVVEEMAAPDRADKLKIHVDGAAGPFSVAVRFLDEDYNVVSERDDTDLSNYAGDSSNDVFLSVDIASPYIQVEIDDDSGSVNEVDYSIYAR